MGGGRGVAEYMPCLAMVLVQMGYAGMNIVSKLAMDSGMNPFVLVTYRQIFATIPIIPFAYFLERKLWPKMTKSILFQIFLCSIFGATMNQVFYFVGLKNSTPTIACALSNVLPAVTFLMAIPFKLEKVGIRERAGQAKVLGTIVCVGGAMLLSFYHGPVVGGQSGIHWKYAENTQGSNTTHGSNFFLGPFLVIASCMAWAVWFIIQARLSDKFPAPYTSSGLICFMASIQCALVGVAADHNPSAWALNSGIKVLTAVYSGVVCSALAFCLMSWCIEKKGPLYVSVFNPLLLVIVAVLSWSLLEEKLYTGTVVGSAFIIAGLYAVLWGKGNEIEDMNKEGGVPKEDKQMDLELQGHLSYADGTIRDAN